MIPGPGPAVEVYASAALLAEASAARIADCAAESIAARGRFDLAVSGGRTPGVVYTRLAQAPWVERIDWERVRLFYTDERAVPPEDPESNHRLVMRTLVAHLPIELRVYRMEAERKDLEHAAEAYARLLPDALDLVLLGIGEDAHTASLFPGSPLLEESERRIGVVRDSPKPPAVRLTVLPRVLAEARALMLLATGAAKADAVARALDPRVPLAEAPAKLALRGAWLLDQAAADRTRS